jgi:hypothetical protein
VDVSAGEVLMFKSSCWLTPCLNTVQHHHASGIFYGKHIGQPSKHHDFKVARVPE